MGLPPTLETVTEYPTLAWPVTGSIAEVTPMVFFTCSLPTGATGVLVEAVAGVGGGPSLVAVAVAVLRTAPAC